jgi:hypothetical protein
MSRRWQLAAAVGVCFVAAYVTRGAWLGGIGQALVCDERAPSGEAIVLDNFNDSYGLFRRGAELQRQGKASRVIVPVSAPHEEDAAAAAEEVANALARRAGLSQWDLVSIEETEPISLNAAIRVREFLLREHIPAMTLVSPSLRSRRSELIYRSVLSSTGIATSCLPVFGATNPQTWTHTWHGIQDVSLQFLKLQYYRFWVLPRA